MSPTHDQIVKPMATQSPSESFNSEGNLWPGDWYIHENGAITGPYSAAQTFIRDHIDAQGKPRLVSRKGFSQWYPIGDLSEIFRLTAQLGQRVAHERRHQTQELESQFSRFNQLRDRTQAPAATVVQPRTATASPTAAGSVVKPYFEPTPRSTNPHTIHQSPVISKATELTISKRELMTEYFLQRGRMRLGKIRQTWLAGFFGLPLSLGLYWLIWLRELNNEISYHTQDPHEKMPPVILALVPILHIFMIYRLAKLISGMEVQNQYRSVSPGLAALFAILPPFALTYLQDAVNRHWLLHAQHAAAKRLESDPTYLAH